MISIPVHHEGAAHQGDRQMRCGVGAAAPHPGDEDPRDTVEHAQLGRAAGLALRALQGVRVLPRMMLVLRRLLPRPVMPVGPPMFTRVGSGAAPTGAHSISSSEELLP